jgi:hypothetical protein
VVRVYDIDESRSQRVSGRGRVRASDEVTWLLAVGRGWAWSYAFTRRPKAVDYYGALNALIAELDARFGKGNWVYLHDYASYASTAEIGAYLRRRGVVQAEGVPRRPLDLRIIEIVYQAMHRATFQWECETRLEQLSLFRDAVEALQDPAILGPLVGEISTRVEVGHFLGGRWIPRNLTVPGVLAGGAAVSTHLEEPQALSRADTLGKVASGITAGKSNGEIAADSGLPSAAVGFLRRRRGLVGDLEPVHCDNAILKGVIPTYNAVPAIPRIDTYSSCESRILRRNRSCLRRSAARVRAALVR